MQIQNVLDLMFNLGGEINGERHYILYAPKKVAKIEVRAAWKEPTDYLQKEVM